MKHKLAKALTATALSLTLAVSTLGVTAQAAQKGSASVNACSHQTKWEYVEKLISAEDANSERHWATYEMKQFCTNCWAEVYDLGTETRYETHTFDSVTDSRRTCSACGYQDEH